jgi:spore maturation protein CgeB
LYIGDSWLGSCARSLKEAFRRRSDITLDEVNIDLFIPKPRKKILRILQRIAKKYYLQDLYEEILLRVSVFKPDIVIVYKGGPLEASFINMLKELNMFVVNIYPDASPHAHGVTHKKAVGSYDLVISTKQFHPKIWEKVYGYKNKCVFVPQGYDPWLHLKQFPPNNFEFDVTLVATWRPEYGDFMKEVGKLLEGKEISVGIGGNGWIKHHKDYPSNWTFAEGLHGQSYVDWLRLGKICIAPVTRNVIVEGKQQPGDVDSTRTYELAAANCFFIHKRTNYASELYDDEYEVPKYDTPKDLVEKILFYLENESIRESMRKAAHERAVPNYSLDSRVVDILTYINNYL